MTSDATVTIELPAGPILALSHNGLVRARGIPYASSKRFQPPQKALKWESTRDCTQPAALCPQLPSRLEMVMGPATRGREFDETCLHLTVTALKDAVNAPVMVWLHGGAFISGGGDLDCYKPDDLARRGIVCVNVSYRLGVFGYLLIPDIAPANLGLLDQRAALQWIQTNISSFGGNSNNVTMVGQSAGADSIVCLLGAEGTEDLFHRAILMSPPFREIHERGPTTALLSAQAQSLFTSDPRTMSVPELLAVQKTLLMNPVQSQVMLFAPSMGHYPLPDDKDFDQRVLNRVRSIPILIGWTAHDGRPFASMMGPLRTWHKTPFVGDYLEAMGTWYITASYFQWPSQRFHQQVLEVGGRSTTYSFEWSPPSSRLGANHCIDIAFVLGDWAAWKEAPMLKGVANESEEDIRQLGGRLKDLWAAFMNGKYLKSDHITMNKQSMLSEHFL